MPKKIEAPAIDLKDLVKIFRNVQKTRVAYLNNFSRYNNEQIKQLYSIIINVFSDIENELQKYIKVKVKTHPLYENYLKHVKGIGKITAAQLITMIGDIKRFPTVTKLWKYAGLGITNNKADRLKRGNKSKFNPKFKGLMYIIGISFLRTNSQYITFYDLARKRYQKKYPEWTKKHIYYASLRYMEKMFLAHVFNAWCRIEGIPMKVPYPVEYLGRKKIILQEDVVEGLKLPKPIWLKNSKEG